MLDFLRLVSNENMKIYRRARTWIMMGILLLLTVSITGMANFLTADEPPTMWFMMKMETQILLTLATIFAVVISGESVAGEFTAGTIKLLLIRPWTRSKILLSKYISVLLFALFTTVLLFAATFAVNLAAFGYDDSTLLGQDGLPPLTYMIRYYVLEFVSLVVVVTLSFMISTVFRSSSLAIGLSMFLLFIGSSVAGLLAMLEYDWADYILFVHLNLTQYLDGGGMIQDMTLGFSLGILAAYYVAFIALSWWIFNRRDVSA